MKFDLSRYTIDVFFNKVVETYPDRPSVCDYGKEPFSFKEMSLQVLEYQELLLDHGIGKGDKVALIDITGMEWAMAYLAIMALGAVAVPVMDEFPPSDINHILEKTQIKGLFSSKKIYSIIESSILDGLTLAVNLKDKSFFIDQKADRKSREIVEEEDLAEILFTSGTTGHSKGVMLSHRNLVSNLFEGPDMLGCIHSHSRTLSFLPMAHAFGSTSSFLSIIYEGSAVYFLGRKPTPKMMMNALRDIKPTILGGVPLIFEKIYFKKVAPIFQKNSFLRFLTAKPAGRKFFYRLIGRKMRKVFGGCMECAIIGGAPLAEEVELFLKTVKIPTVLGYGMTEASPLIAFSSREAAKKGSVGKAITDEVIEIVNADPETGVGEVRVKGPNVMMGYFQDPEETAKVLTEDGWLLTGDKGFLDEEGFLYLKGRSKNVILGPSGENIYPEVIESVFSSYPSIAEVIVYAKGSKLIANILPNEELLKNLTDKSHEVVESLLKTYEDIKKEVNAKLPPHSRINEILLRETPFIKTVSNKIKRSLYVLD